MVSIARLLFVLLVVISGSAAIQRCSLCKFKVGVLDCSGLDLVHIPRISNACKLRTRTLNLNYNSFVDVPKLTEYGWRHVDVVYIRENPLDCETICGHDQKRILITDCVCGE